ncbi:hypothetical protein [Gimibacter soli]|uniref:Uncharacterized protein n=1 Tax=Gimibacter soli TaxID=3024400 RepID=A0AAE9XV83_9PROT|nr:hypothetical protein [Gimibacter soli]WCL55400.1 hypothetical protein PH603_06465 [Gimibacter soli]
MTNTNARSRQQAEPVVDRKQLQIVARERAFEELEEAASASDEKTVRLREARLAREMKDRLKAAAARAVTKSARKA